MHFNGKPSNWDRITAYRVAAFVLVVQIVISLGARDWGWWNPPLLVIRIPVWIGATILVTAVALDWLEVYRGKRDIEKRIRSKKSQDQEV